MKSPLQINESEIEMVFFFNLEHHLKLKRKFLLLLIVIARQVLHCEFSFYDVRNRWSRLSSFQLDICGSNSLHSEV